MIEIIKYHSELKDEWNSFVEKADNFSFLFYRDYMEYHSDRFTDFSLMLYDKRKLKALLPGSINNSHFSSHPGLTYGGMIHQPAFTFDKAQLYYAHFFDFLKRQAITSTTIKLQPFFYPSSYTQVQPFLLNNIHHATSSKDIGAFIHCKNHTFPKSTIEKRKLQLDQFYVEENASLEEYWQMLKQNLATYHQSKPVHTLAEIENLQRTYPDHIKLFCIRNRTSHHIDAGTLYFDQGEIAKMQYIASSIQGRTNRATHALYYLFIKHLKSRSEIIDMGTCMKNNEVNTSLLYLKQRFGAEVYFTQKYSFSI
ncbi:hypothetical protein [Saccharicrinis fermentans]|uniref:BioF2-like acetyltransferase domain-containing protein n=1 Tax=Saccharicrinis fermentans DSM 9555 = JCM 21142 TaxID=869213 RepID=W7Y6Z0_9BACT|nr:hypothetical protein [Saccharicrinis fermentans]GAF03423.1 hypothetical protein JCM21142_52098 [Saccharicrinis fermentans DSM 9555 = JCM 21142]